MMSNEWSTSSITGSSKFKLVRALKLLKPSLRSLNKQNFNGISQRVKEKGEEVADLHKQLLTSLNSDMVREEIIVHEACSRLATAEEKFYHQKSWVRWLDLGDKNTSFFHKMVIQRNSQNHIHFLKDSNARKITSPRGLKENIEAYFNLIFGQKDLPFSPISLGMLQVLMTFSCSNAHIQIL